MKHKESEGHKRQVIGNKVWVCDYRFKRPSIFP